MTLPVVWLPEAQAELMEALAHYEAIRPGLRVRFANAAIEAVETIAEAPLRFAVVDKGCGALACGGFRMVCFSSWKKPASW